MTMSQPSSTEGLELELRQLPGVECVSFTDQDSVTVIEIGTDGTIEDTSVAREVARLSQAYLDTDIEVRLNDQVPSSTSGATGLGLRVQLVTTVVKAGTGTNERREIHLAHQGRRTMAEAGPRDRIEIAKAVIVALRQIGFAVPFEVEAVHLLSPDLGAGVLVVMVDPLSGERRRGVADRRTPEEAIARAVLNGLNRHLQTVERAQQEL